MVQKTIRLVLALALIGLYSAAPAWADRIVETRHSITVEGKQLNYTARAGLLTVKDPRFGTSADFFFAAYSLDSAAEADRPLTFVFNGGPGASSVYLHLLAVGPYRVELPDDGSLPEPPARLIENSDTWLTFTDLVMIDPVGTGYSRCLDCMGIGYKPYWGVLQDRNSVADFISAYLDNAGRRGSPIFIAGESYGGIRGPLLLNYLPSLDVPIRPAGGVLISPAVDLGALGSNGNKYNLRPFITVIPAYATIAAYHGRADTGGKSIAEFRAEVEAFAMGDYLSALAHGRSLDPAQRSRVYGLLSGYTGLGLDVIERLEGRIGMLHFSKELLRDQGLLTGWFDGTITGPDPQPQSQVSTVDYSSNRVDDLVKSVVEDYLFQQLGFSSDKEYITLNLDAEPNWDWAYPPTAQGDGQGWVIVGDELAEAMNADSSLRVVFAAGYYDTVVPYFAHKYLFDHMDLNSTSKNNLSLKIYNGGHMVYSHKDARAQFTKDMTDFYAPVTPRQSAEGRTD